MAVRQVIIELKYTRDLAASAFAAAAQPDAALDAAVLPKIPGVTFDPSFAATVVPGVAARSAMDAGYESGVKFDLAVAPEESTYIVRAQMEESDAASLVGQKGVIGCFADVEIHPTLICPGSPPLGTDADVERLLCVPQLHRIGMDGLGVLVAIVDTGFNMAYLHAHGKTPHFDPMRSWVPQAGLVPGSLPVDHGTMCAFDACIAAPRCTLLDIALLRTSTSGPTVMSGVLSDGVRAYSHLLRIMTAPRRPGETRSMIVSNSWGMFHPSWDFPVGSPGNYSDNPNHPFNRIVAALERAGADILFAAGNCGPDCPDGRCGGVTANAIYGANGHPSVLCVAGVDITKQRVGYSSVGPGRLSRNKPDICGYTHFRGSGVYSADGGTSAATPVVAGVVATIRNKRPFMPGNPAVTPAAVRALVRTTAEDRGAAGYDFLYGFGIINGCELYRRFRPGIFPDICRRYPDLCRPRPVPIDFCRRFPSLCRPRLPVPQPPPGPGPGAQAGEAGYTTVEIDPQALAALDTEELIEVLLELGFLGASGAPQPAGGGRTGPCSCSGANG